MSRCHVISSFGSNAGALDTGSQIIKSRSQRGSESLSHQIPIRSPVTGQQKVLLLHCPMISDQLGGQVWGGLGLQVTYPRYLDYIFVILDPQIGI